MMKLILLLVCGYMGFTTLQAQSFSVNTDGSTAHSSAILDIKSTDKGLLIPRLTKVQRNAILAPASGLLVYQSGPDSTGFYYYNGAAWLWLAVAGTAQGWLTTGNTGTDTSVNFIGTHDAMPLRFKQNNGWVGQLDTNTENIMLGGSAGEHNRRGLRNTVIGDSALSSQSYDPGVNFLSDNTAIGSKALRFNQPTSTVNGVKNVAVGNEAMYLNTTGYENTAIGVSALRSNTTGYGNTAIGRNANRLAQSGTYNTYMGYNTGYSDTAGTSNTGLGTQALYGHRTGQRNTAVGYGALQGDSTGYYNTALGANASFQNDSAILNTSVGYSALFYNKRSHNTAVGAYAGYNISNGTGFLTEGVENTMVGFAAMLGHARGSKNTVLGYKAMAIYEPLTIFSAATAFRNVAIGDSALHQNRGDDQVAVGFRALSSSNASAQNQSVAVGSYALTNAVANYPNTAVGYLSQDSTSTGYANTSLGSYSLSNMKTGINNTAIGNAAMYEARGVSSNLSNNTAVGNDALRKTRYNFQTAVGASALSNDTSGAWNTAIGGLAMYSNTSSAFNTALGYNAMYYHNRAGWNYNTALGSFAMEQDSSGYQNTGVGTSAFRNNRTGFYNTGVGINAGYYQKKWMNTFVGAYSGVGERGPTSADFAADTGIANTALGYYSMRRIANGGFNVGIGSNALMNDSSGTGNTAVGYYTLNSILDGDYNTGFGWGADVANNLTNAGAIGSFAYAAQNNTLILGSISGVNGATANTSVGIGTNTPVARLDVDANFKLGNNGTVLNEMIKTSAVYDIVSLAAGGTDIQTFTVTNALTTSTVMISPAAALPNGIIIAYARVSAANTVEVKFYNASAGVIDPVNNTFYITVIR